MNENKIYPPLIWLDLEMSGLDPDSERIIEIATVVTNADLDEIKEGPNLVIRQPQEYIDGMDEWNINQHTNSGLIDCLKATKISETDAEKQTLEFLRKHAKKGKRAQRTFGMYNQRSHANKRTASTTKTSRFQFFVRKTKRNFIFNSGI